MKILYAHTSNIDYVRVKKNLEYFDTFNSEIIYFGAFRVGQNVSFYKNNYINTKVIYYRKTLVHGWKSMINFAGYLINLNKLIREHKPGVLILTNEELYFSLFFLNTKNICVIIDAIDALDIRVESNVVVRWFLGKFVKYVRNKSDRIVEVEEFRKDRFPKFKDKTFVIRNTPYIFKEIIHEAVEKSSNDVDYIYASGSLNQDTNGIEVLIDAVNLVNSYNSKKINVIIAGIIVGEKLSSKIQENNFVSYVGSISLNESFSLASKSIAMFAFYRPDRLNFINAAPNKVYESFMLGKPILINDECLIAQFCEDKGNGFLSSYFDIVGLSENIIKINNNSNIRYESLKNDFKDEMCWELEKREWNQVLLTK
jgi:glycosyltransferase involved in cell wall biosynthesis